MTVLKQMQINYVEIAAVILFGIGFSMLLLNRNLIRKIIGFSFTDSAIYLFLASEGYISGAKAPILDAADPVWAGPYINPVPAGLVLTGIVVSVSVTALMLALTVRLYRRYGTLNIDEITRKYRQEEDE